MGSWNKSCGLSNLHITPGVKVYVFLLERNPSDDDRCYSTAFWYPSLIPFESVYADYGAGEHSHEHIKHTLDGLKQVMIDVEQGENERHDIAVKAADMSEELFFEAVHEGRLKVKRYGREEVQCDFTMFRKDIVDSICATWEREHYVGDGKGTTGWGNNYVKYKFQDLIDMVPDYLDRVEEKLKSTNHFGLLSDGVLGAGCAWSENSIIRQYVTRTDQRTASVVRVDDIILELIKTGNRTELEAVTKSIILTKFIDAFMDETRKVWIPGCHEGSQNCDDVPYRLLTEAIIDVLNREKAEWELDELDEDDSE